VLHHAAKPSRFSRWIRTLGLALSALLVGSILTIGLPSTTDDAANAAPPASSFDPGLIISDAVMFDFGAMSLESIQSFMDSKVATCSSSAAVACLKDYKADTRDVAAVTNRCTGSIAGAKNVSSAEIIYQVSRACEVNPKVLLVTLQKEQGLVTSTSPTATKYRIAMGYGCPDTAPCDSTYYGFFNQVYQAAYAYNKYTKSPDQYTAYQPGSRKIQYKPNSSCGTATVNIKSKATGALYFYTPYVPNTAALNNPYGIGDSCSSYGNRNFWVYFNDWFGSPVGGSFLIDTAAGQTYILIDGTKWEIPANRAGLLTTLAPLGKVGRVSAAYAKNFPGSASFTNLVVDGNGVPYLLDNGHRYSFTDCNQAADLGFSCASAPVMPDAMLAYFSVSGALSSYVTTSTGAGFALGGGQKREVLDAASAAAIGVPLPAASSVLDDTLSSVTLGFPIIRDGVLIQGRGTNTFYFSTSTATYEVNSTLIDQTGLTGRVGTAVGALDPQSIASLPGRVVFHGLFTEPTGAAWVLTKKGKAQVTDPGEWGGNFVGIDDTFAALLPATGDSLSAPLFVKDHSTSTTVLLKNKKRQPATTKAVRKALAKKVGTTTTVTTLSGDTVAILGKALIAPATVVKASKTSKKLWFIDGASKKRPISAKQAKELTGSSKAKVVPATTINGFTTVKGSAKLGLKVKSTYYVADGGVLRKVSAAYKTRYGSKFGFGSYDATTVAALKKGVDIGRVIKVGSKYYEVKNSKKVRISSAKAKKIATATGKKTQAVTAYFGSLLTTK
jgi:hypothetical protein